MPPLPQSHKYLDHELERFLLLRGSFILYANAAAKDEAVVAFNRLAAGRVMEAERKLIDSRAGEALSAVDGFG